MAKHPPFDKNQFLQRLDEYLSPNALIQDFDSEFKPLPEPAPALEPDTFYLFNSEALLALTEAIEDIALEEANGSVIASIQDFTNLKGNKERYTQLSATMDSYQIVGAGTPPKITGIKTKRSDSLSRCWSVIYSSKKISVALLAEQLRPGKNFDEAQFTGFYTCDKKLIALAEKDIDDVLCQKCPALNEFKRLQRLDLAQKKLKCAFAREQADLAKLLHRMKSSSALTRKGIMPHVKQSMSRLKDCAGEVQALLLQG